MRNGGPSDLHFVKRLTDGAGSSNERRHSKVSLGFVLGSGSVWAYTESVHQPVRCAYTNVLHRFLLIKEYQNILKRTFIPFETFTKIFSTLIYLWNQLHFFFFFRPIKFIHMDKAKIQQCSKT
jgi:hypothetical protein